MHKKIILTGITPTGLPHLGNYVGAIKPALALMNDKNKQAFLFLADYHSLIKGGYDAKKRHLNCIEVAATWLAFGLETEQTIFYRQSDIPQIMELNWILNCLCSKGLMNRAHAYKAAVQQNIEAGEQDLDKGITMGLFSYPVLMAADILLLKAEEIPVGVDQVQHIEMARDMALRMNHHYHTGFILPNALVNKENAVISGLDGRKMSKSYQNTIPLFCSESQLLKLIKKIKTNSLEPGQPKNPDECTLFQLFCAFIEDPQLIQNKREQYAQGTGWGVLKEELFVVLNNALKKPRERFFDLMRDPASIELKLNQGAEQCRDIASQHLQKIKKKIGLFSFNVSV